MMLRIIITFFLSLFVVIVSNAQSKTTVALQEKYNDSFSLFFYNNTLRMINQQEDKEFDEIIKDIEKMKFLMLKKETSAFNYKGLVTDYKNEMFEEVMTSRHEGKNFDIFVKEKNGKTQAMLVLVNDTDNLFVLDILGSIALDKVTKLYSVMDESSDIGSKIQKFVSKGEKEESNAETKD
jgi:hypothetical protein